MLKDASSTSIYGARAANGVVVITSKRGLAMDKAESDLAWAMGDFHNWRRMITG